MLLEDIEELKNKLIHTQPPTYYILLARVLESTTLQ